MNNTKKKILITGAAGFVGSHLTEFFIKKGYKVIAFDRYNSFNSFGVIGLFQDRIGGLCGS